MAMISVNALFLQYYLQLICNVFRLLIFVYSKMLPSFRKLYHSFLQKLSKNILNLFVEYWSRFTNTRTVQGKTIVLYCDFCLPTHACGIFICFVQKLMNMSMSLAPGGLLVNSPLFNQGQRGAEQQNNVYWSCIQENLQFKSPVLYCLDKLPNKSNK